MKKKVVTFIVLVTFLLVAVTGCGGNTTAPQNTTTTGSSNQNGIKVDKPTTINFFGMNFGAISKIGDIMKKVGNANNIAVNVKLASWDDLQNQSKVTLSAGGVSPYEVMQAYNGWLPMYIDNGWIMPLNQYFDKYKDKYDFSDIPKSLWDAMSSNGKIYGLPIQQNLQHLFYRKDIFQKYGLQPPKTFDQLFQVLDVLKAKGDTKYPFALALGGASGAATEFNNALIAYGGQWFDQNNKPTFNSKEGIEAINFLKKLLPYMPKEVLSYSNNDVSIGLQQEKIAMANLWTTRFSEVEDPTASKVAGKMGYAPPPSSTEGGIPFSNWTQDMFVIPKSVSVDPDVIFQVMAETLNKENAKEIAPDTIVPRSSVAGNSSLIATHPNYKAVNETIANGAKSYPIKPYFNSASLIVGGYVSQALSGSISPEEALQKAEADVTKDMQQKGYLK